MSRLVHWLMAIALLAAPPAAIAQPKAAPLPALTGYRTTATAVAAKVETQPPVTVSQPGYLGVEVESNKAGKLTVADVDAASPAFRAGVKVGDVIRGVAGRAVSTVAGFRDELQTRSPGETVTLDVLRGDKPLPVTVKLAAPSRPLSVDRRTYIGITPGPGPMGGVRVASVTVGSPAETAGLKVGDMILKTDGQEVGDPLQYGDAISARQPGEKLQLTIKRETKEMTLTVTLGEAPTGGGGGGGGRGWDDRLPRTFKKPVYRLGVILINFPDVTLNPKITAQDWETSLFSEDTYVDKSPTGQPVYGSLRDYYLDLSCGALKVEGKVLAPVKVTKKRADYLTTPSKTALLSEAADELVKRDGKDALKGFDGIFFMHAGGRVQTNRGGIYWPHRANFQHQGSRWSYFICPEGGDRMGDISVLCHEFGHMIGLPDLYARPENPGSEGVGVWCAMSNQTGGGLPQHFSAWSKEQLGWIKPVVIDPSVKQKLILSPIEGTTTECFKVPIRPDGSEYLLLENRKKKGFDHALPAEGLLIWRILDGRPFLEESHGILGPEGPRRYLTSVPFPSPSNTAFTPYTTPSSRSQKGGGKAVHITNIRKLSDGRITFHIGYEYY